MKPTELQTAKPLTAFRKPNPIGSAWWERFLPTPAAFPKLEASSQLWPTTTAQMAALLEGWGLNYELSTSEAQRIPAQGGLLVVGNQPFGFLEGLILAKVMLDVRQDVKLMIGASHAALASDLLQGFPGMAEMLLIVEPGERKARAGKNIKPLKQAIQWLKQGHALVMFPAATAAHWDLKRREISDPAWDQRIARVIRCAQTDVLPVFFAGQNSRLFSALGWTPMAWRQRLLHRETLHVSQAPISLRIGQPLEFKKLQKLEEDTAMMAYLRSRTYLLQHSRLALLPGEASSLNQPSLVPVVEARDPLLLAAEVQGLPAECRLVEQSEFWVICARAEQIPQSLYEIGRLRELTFRAVGEGTGQAIDLDHFDEHYYHLFVWQREKQEIVGSYRLGPSDEILKRFGKKGLYTHTLFKFKKKLFKKLGPVLELGRSFVRTEYQRSFSPLLLLWKGIGQFVFRHPQYARLLGPVSINKEYHPISRQLILEALKQHYARPDLAEYIKPRHPFQSQRIAGYDKQVTRLLKDLQEVSALLVDIETGMKGVPILLTQYLKMGGEVLSSNVDPQFSDVLDILMLVDLRHTEPKLLARYMGAQEAEIFRHHHHSA